MPLKYSAVCCLAFGQNKILPEIVPQHGKMIPLRPQKKFERSGPRSTMDSIRVSEAPDSGSIPDEATNKGCAAMPPFSCSIMQALDAGPHAL